MKVSQEEKQILLHTLGLDREKTAYRNHFVAGPGHDELPILQSLCEKGYMIQTRAPSFCPLTDMVFSVTDTGKELVGAA